MTSESPQTLTFELTFYLVRNYEGKFFRAKGFSGYGESWVEGAEKAKIYTRLASARGTVSYFAKDTRYPIPEILEVKATTCTVLNEQGRVEKAKLEKAVREQASIRAKAKEDLRRAQADLERAQQKIDALKAQQ